MRKFDYQTVDVFTSRRFGGNPLAVFSDARGLSDLEMQSLAAEFNYSETTFVLPPENANHTARIRIFNRTAEMPFAGHPNVGTAFVIATNEHASCDVLTFEEIAGLVTVRLRRDSSGTVSGAEIEAPQPLSVGKTLPASAVAACGGLTEADVVVESHEPTLVSVGLPFFVAEVTPSALDRAAPSLSGFQDVAAEFGKTSERLSMHYYSRSGTGNVLRARMFSPLTGTWEDPATGSANAALAAFLLSIDDAAETARFEIDQGVEMGRPSRLSVVAARESGRILATVGGACVPVLKGSALLG